MTTRVIETPDDRQALFKLLSARKLPFTVNVTQGKKRSLDQNKLAFKWYGEIAEQLGDRTAEDVRALCKLKIGVPIRCQDSDTYYEMYDVVVKPQSYENKMKLMALPFDLAVTRDMTTAQLTRYLDEIVRVFGEQGVVLTQPDDRGRET